MRILRSGVQAVASSDGASITFPVVDDFEGLGVVLAFFASLRERIGVEWAFERALGGRRRWRERAE